MKGDDKMIKWSKNYLMGIDKLDEEHKELFRISDQIYNKVMERGDDAKYRLFLMNETLEYMLRYFKRHAKGEEIYMREIGYAGYEFHKMLHDEFYNMPVLSNFAVNALTIISFPFYIFNTRTLHF